MFKTKIILKDENPKRLARIFYPEQKSLHTKRFSSKMQTSKEGIIFELEATDKIAFKIVTTAINKLTTVYNKIKKIS